MRIHRLRQEIKDVQKSSMLRECGISVSLSKDSNLYHWIANIPAPRASLYEGKSVAIQYSGDVWRWESLANHHRFDKIKPFKLVMTGGTTQVSQALAGLSYTF